MTERSNKTQMGKGVAVLIAAVLLLAGLLTGGTPALAAGDDISPPAGVVKLIFIHHSTGQNWLADDNGGLGRALGENHYFVSDTNYGWGPNGIGDRTDIPDWLEWFRGPDAGTIMAALAGETGQRSDYTRTLTDPGGANTVILFKSCFPNSALEGSPADPPSADGWLTVGHAKYVYNQLLTYFQSRPDRLFVVITAPPLSDGTYAANARAFNQWLVNDWLNESHYGLKNVAVFDFYNVLTGPNNHHRYTGGAVQHVFTAGMNTNYYPSSGGDDHPSRPGNLKATAEFVPLLNLFYHRWQDSQAGPPTIGGCSLFPADNIWNTRIDGLSVHARSADWIDSIGRTRPFHMDFGSGTWDGGPIGIPYNVVDAGLPGVTFDFDYADESDPGPYPIPADPAIEYGSDHHLLIVERGTCRLYEVYAAEASAAGWHAGSGAIWDLGSNALRPAGWTSADAAGLPILPGLVRYDEIAAGAINHALRFTAAPTSGYIWPARHQTAAAATAPEPPPMGARFRLKADYDITGFPGEIQVILRALKTYGIILADNGSDWFISGVPDARWDNDQLHRLDVLTGDDFEAVDTAGLMVDPDSGAVQAAALPGAFSKLTPADGAVNQPPGPTLSWAASAGAGTFEYCYGTAADADCDPWLGSGAATSVTLAGLPAGTWYWQVRASNVLGTTPANGGAWWRFTVDARIPLLLTPADGEQLLFNRPVFDWSDVGTATGYTLQIARDAAFRTLVGTYTTGPSTYTPLTELPAGKTLYWRVRMKRGSTLGPWSAVRQVQTASPPGIPTLRSPAANALLTGYTPVLDWNNVVVPAGSPAFGQYRLQVDDSADFASPVLDLYTAASDYAVSAPLAANATWFWRVSAYNVLGQYSAWSAVRSFRTALVAPALLSPADGFTTTARRPPFDWTDVAGAAGYTMQVSRNLAFTSLVGSYNPAASAYTPTANLPIGTLYWRARTRGGNGPSAWSPAWQIVITR